MGTIAVFTLIPNIPLLTSATPIMLIVEFRVDSPILEETLSQNPHATVTHEEIYRDGDSTNFLFWAETNDFDAFEAGLNDDPTVENPQILTKKTTSKLYRVTFTPRGEDTATFPVWSELDLVLLDSRATQLGWDVRMRMPNREALTAYRETCREQGLSFDLKAVYHDTGETSTAGSDLSTSQQKALQTAQEMGYFEIPRKASLADVAAELGISSQSLSERIRRGVDTLVQTSLPRDADINT